MALPAAWTTVNVHGKFIDLSGAPMVGNIVFTAEPNALVDVTDLITIMNKPLTATLDGTGTVSVNLPATDDPDINPTSFTYRVTENFVGATGRSYNISVSIVSAVGGIDLAQIAPVVNTVGQALPYSLSRLTDVQLGTLVDRDVLTWNNTLGDWVNAPANIVALDWAAFTNYNIRQIVVFSNQLWRANSTHTSGGTWPGAAQWQQLSAATATVSDATPTTNGVIRLTNGLGGTAASPTIAAVTIAALPAGSIIVVDKTGGIWPGGTSSSGVRPTARSDIIVRWRGSDPSPATVSSGTAGMLNNVDERVTLP